MALNPQTATRIETYRQLMELVKERCIVIEIITADQHGLSDWAINEICYLQLRLICESIALACLSAHGEDLGVIRRMLREWSANTIMNNLEALHPDFFPRAVHFTGMHGNTAVHEKVVGAMTKAEFIVMYGQVHQQMHQGNLKEVFSNQHLTRDFEPIREYCTRLTQLLEQHEFSLRDDKEFWLCYMRRSPDGAVHVMVGEVVCGLLARGRPA